MPGGVGGLLSDGESYPDSDSTSIKAKSGFYALIVLDSCCPISSDLSRFRDVLKVYHSDVFAKSFITNS